MGLILEVEQENSLKKLETGSWELTLLGDKKQFSSREEAVEAIKKNPSVSLADVKLTENTIAKIIKEEVENFYGVK